MSKNKKTPLFKILRRLYLDKYKSVPEVAKLLSCSENKINYWLAKYNIPKRTISDAIYIKHNPDGDPFKFKLPQDLEDGKLFGIGLGLYWGEGNRANKHALRIGNSDPALLRIFIVFLEKFFKINKKDLKFHLHVFSDININDSYNYWTKELCVDKKQFYKPTITKTGKLGTYKHKSKYGVLTIYYNNVRLRNILINQLEELRNSNKPG